jgi:nitrogen-specific signal transduction histidine kinase/ABC-type branched-subunit amino acid transport system ATPase component
MSSAESEDILVVEGLNLAVLDKVILRGLDLRVKRGEVHCLFGDDALPRSSLLKLIAGECRPCEGTVVFDGHPVRKISPRLAMRMGIEIVDASTRCFLNLSVAENVFAERQKVNRQGRMDMKTRRRRAREFFDTIGVGIELDAPLSGLYPPYRKLVEIARSVCSFPKLLLIDESVVDQLKTTAGESIVEKLYYYFALFASGGATILSSSNNMDQLLNFADRVSVLRDGSIEATMMTKDVDKIELVEMAYSSILSRNDLARTNFELFYLKQIYEGIFDSMGIPIIVADSRGKVILVNRGAERLFKSSKDRFFSLPLSRVLGVEVKVFKDVEDEMHKMSRTQFHRIADIMPGVDAFACPVLDEADSYMGMLLLFSRPNAALNVAEELQTNSEKFNSEQYIAKFIHEIKNPLGIILNYLRLIQTGQAQDKISDSALHIEHEVERISRLLEQPKGTRAAAKQERPPMRMSAIIDEMADLLIPNIAKNEIKLGFDFAYDPLIPFDPDLIRQVALNVMLNGIEAMPEGGNLDIACKSETLDGREYVVIEIVDTGVGISEENLDKIFEPFFTTKSGEQTRGIGLSICKEIVNNLDGFFRVASSPGQGSCFKIYLPLSTA